MGLQIALFATIILTTDGLHLKVDQRQTETGDPLIILLSIFKLSISVNSSEFKPHHFSTNTFIFRYVSLLHFIPPTILLLPSH